MGRAHDKDPEQSQPVSTEPAAAEPVGRVEVDSRGRNVWRWARDVIESTSVLLKRLENDDLALEPTQKVPIVKGAVPAPKGPKQGAKPGASKSSTAKPEPAETAPRHPALQSGRGSGGKGGGFDPYNSR